MAFIGKFFHKDHDLLVFDPIGFAPWHRLALRSMVFFCHFAALRHNSPACSQKHPNWVNVVHQVAQADLCSGSVFADRAQRYIPRSLRLYTKDMLDQQTYLGFGIVTFLFSGRQWMIAAPLALNVFTKTVLDQTLQSFRRSIGRDRPDVLSGAGSKELLEHIAVVQGRIGQALVYGLWNTPSRKALPGGRWRAGSILACAHRYCTYFSRALMPKILAGSGVASFFISSRQSFGGELI